MRLNTGKILILPLDKQIRGRDAFLSGALGSLVDKA